MAVAKERVPVQEVVDRIPHPKIQYAFLEVRNTGTVEEFLAFRSELLRKHPLYQESSLARQPEIPVGDKIVVEYGDDMDARDKIVAEYGDDMDALEAAEAFQADVAAAVDEPTSEAEPAAAAPIDAKAAAKAKLAAKKDGPVKTRSDDAPAPTEGRSARDIARAKILAKKGA